MVPMGCSQKEVREHTPVQARQRSVEEHELVGAAVGAVDRDAEQIDPGPPHSRRLVIGNRHLGDMKVALHT
jgi:hypothetical protein